jgi:hypothetical protein
MLEFDAELEGWIYDPKHKCIWGYVYRDTKGRFVDGTWIHTSSIPNPNPNNYEEGVVVQTRNTRYLLGEPKVTEPTLMEPMNPLNHL